MVVLLGYCSCGGCGFMVVYCEMKTMGKVK